MTERLHPDGKPVSARPVNGTISLWKTPQIDVMRVAEELEDRAREAETVADERLDRIVELEREVAWLRKGPQFHHHMIEPDIIDEVRRHLASKPPEGWTP